MPKLLVTYGTIVGPTNFKTSGFTSPIRSETSGPSGFGRVWPPLEQHKTSVGLYVPESTFYEVARLPPNAKLATGDEEALYELTFYQEEVGRRISQEPKGGLWRDPRCQLVQGLT